MKDMQQMTLGSMAMDLNASNNFAFEATVQAGSIRSNGDELKQYVQQHMAEYEMRTYVGDDAIKKMKKDRADLNKLVSDVEKRRKEIKKQYTKPLTEFEQEVKNLITFVQEPIDHLNEKIRVQEEKLKAETRKKIQLFYVEYVKTTDLINEVEYRTQLFKQIYDQKWENMSVPQKTWKTAIMSAVNQYLEGKQILLSMNEPEFFPEALLCLQKTQKCDDAIALIKQKVSDRQERERIRIEAEAKAKAQYEAELKKKEAEQKKRIEEEIRKREAEIKKKMVADNQSALNFEKHTTKTEMKSASPVMPNNSASPKKEAGMVTFSVRKQDAQKVEQFLFMNDIRYKMGLEG